MNTELPLFIIVQDRYTFDCNEYEYVYVLVSIVTGHWCGCQKNKTARILTISIFRYCF
jgi:hypothetical protein